MNDFIDKRKDNPRKRNMSPKLRFEILRRDGFTCQYCGKTGTDKELEIDHVVPFSKGGTNDEGNLITACFDCNRGKRDTEIIPNDEPMPAMATPIDPDEMMIKLCENKTIDTKTLSTYFDNKYEHRKDKMDTTGMIESWKNDCGYDMVTREWFTQWYLKYTDICEHWLQFGEYFKKCMACMVVGIMLCPRDEKYIRH